MPERRASQNAWPASERLDFIKRDDIAHPVIELVPPRGRVGGNRLGVLLLVENDGVRGWEGLSGSGDSSPFPSKG